MADAQAHADTADAAEADAVEQQHAPVARVAPRREGGGEGGCGRRGSDGACQATEAACHVDQRSISPCAVAVVRVHASSRDADAADATKPVAPCAMPEPSTPTAVSPACTRGAIVGVSSDRGTPIGRGAPGSKGTPSGRGTPGSRGTPRLRSRPAPDWVLPEDLVQRRSCWHDYRPGQLLGRGSSGTTYRCVRLSDGRPFAVKMVPKHTLTAEHAACALRDEVMALRQLSGHPNVVSLEAVYEDAAFVCIVMELCAAGDLSAALGGGRLGERTAARVVAQMAAALAHVHSCGFVHRDVKPGNFLVASASSTAGGGGHLLRGLCIKAVDFGLAMKHDGDAGLCAGAAAWCAGGLGIGGPGRARRCSVNDIAGTLAYMAPEVLRGEPAGPSSDLWSLGVSAAQLLTGSMPFVAQSPARLARLILGQPGGGWSVSGSEGGATRTQAAGSEYGSPVGGVGIGIAAGGHGFLSRSTSLTDAGGGADEDPLEALRAGSGAWAGLSVGCRALLLWLLCRDPLRRASAADVLSDPWVLRHAGMAGGTPRQSLAAAAAAVAASSPNGSDAYLSPRSARAVSTPGQRFVKGDGGGGGGGGGGSDSGSGCASPGPMSSLTSQTSMPLSPMRPPAAVAMIGLQGSMPSSPTSASRRMNTPSTGPSPLAPACVLRRTDSIAAQLNVAASPTKSKPAWALACGASPGADSHAGSSPGGGKGKAKVLAAALLAVASPTKRVVTTRTSSLSRHGSTSSTAGGCSLANGSDTRGGSDVSLPLVAASERGSPCPAHSESPSLCALSALTYSTDSPLWCGALGSPLPPPPLACGSGKCSSMACAASSPHDATGVACMAPARAEAALDGDQLPCSVHTLGAC
uniref:Protein kinase domain-containing protein n=1 Tax=Chlamydomonas euryale TaxID=1486919 RepID=A0A6U2IBV6_9CHLO